MTSLPKKEILTGPARWSLSFQAETSTSDHASAACYCRPEHVGIEAVVIAELEFGDVERHIFGAHFVERADNAALEDRPEALNRIRVDRTDHVLLFVVLHGLTRVFGQAIINLVIVGRQQANFVGNHLADERHSAFGVDVIEHAGNHVALPLHRANDCRLAGGLRAGLAVVALVPVAILVLAADERFVHFHNAPKLHSRVNQRRAYFVAHGMGRLIAAEAQHALDLKGAHSLLTRKHQMGDAIPVTERLLGVLKNRPCEARKPITLRRAGSALPMEGLVAGGIVQVRIATAGAGDAARPAPRDQVAKTRLVIPDRKAVLELLRGHLRDWFRTICHGGYPSNLSVEGYYRQSQSLSTGR
jgi:hypothetical protein